VVVPTHQAIGFQLAQLLEQHLLRHPRNDRHNATNRVSPSAKCCISRASTCRLSCPRYVDGAPLKVLVSHTTPKSILVTKR
jgi:hypothetical protein